MQDLIPLSLLAAGQSARIHHVVGTHHHTRRLNELGFREGVQVEMVRQGTPCIVRLDDNKFCFREADTSSVLVALESSLPLEQVLPVTS